MPKPNLLVKIKRKLGTKQTEKGWDDNQKKQKKKKTAKSTLDEGGRVKSKTKEHKFRPVLSTKN